MRYVDRDAHAELKETLTICGGSRVPQVVFFSEDMQQVGRYGDRTLAKYRQMAASLGGAACSTGVLGANNGHAEVVQDWLNEFERIQLILRTSPRLRTKHSDWGTVLPECTLSASMSWWIEANIYRHDEFRSSPFVSRCPSPSESSCSPVGLLPFDLALHSFGLICVGVQKRPSEFCCLEHQGQ